MKVRYVDLVWSSDVICHSEKKPILDLWTENTCRLLISRMQVSSRLNSSAHPPTHSLTLSFRRARFSLTNWKILSRSRNPSNFPEPKARHWSCRMLSQRNQVDTLPLFLFKIYDCYDIILSLSLVLPIGLLLPHFSRRTPYGSPFLRVLQKQPIWKLDLLFLS